MERRCSDANGARPTSSCCLSLPRGRPMSTMTVSLPETLKDFVDDQVGARGYATSGEYVRELIRRDRDRQCLGGLLLEGAASPGAAVADGDYFDRLRDRVREAGGG